MNRKIVSSLLGKQLRGMPSSGQSELNKERELSSSFTHSI